MQELVSGGVQFAVARSQGVALRAMANVTRKAIRKTTLFKDKTGNLRRSVVVRNLSVSIPIVEGGKRGNAVRRVSGLAARLGFRAGTGGGQHNALVNFGHRIVTGGTARAASGQRQRLSRVDAQRRTGTGRVRGRTKGRFFVEQALRDTETERANKGYNAFRGQYTRLIEQEQSGKLSRANQRLRELYSRTQ